MKTHLFTLTGMGSLLVAGLALLVQPARGGEPPAVFRMEVDNQIVQTSDQDNPLLAPPTDLRGYPQVAQAQPDKKDDEKKDEKKKDEKKKDEKKPKEPAPKEPAPVLPEIFADNPMPTAFAPRLNPQMIGDFLGVFGQASSGQSSQSSQSGQSSQSRPAVEIGSIIKIADNQGPLPVDRVFLTGNYFNFVNSPGAGGPGSTVYTESFGFEKTFRNGEASFGAIVPIFQTVGGQQGWGDLTLTSKWAFFHNLETGNAVSTGLALTLPTGLETHVSSATGPEVIHSVRFQPYLGWTFNYGDFYFLGFNSINVPTDASDILLIFNDVSVGYWLYRDENARFLTYVVPTLELHINTPLNHTSSTDPISSTNIVDFTFGAHFGIGQSGRLTVAGVVPISDPQPFSFELAIQLNWQF
jgi:hypothetical protein